MIRLPFAILLWALVALVVAVPLGLGGLYLTAILLEPEHREMAKPVPGVKVRP